MLPFSRRTWTQLQRLPHIAASLLMAVAPVAAQGGKTPLARNEVDAIARLLMMEDRREFDSPSLAELVRSSHPEVRRRTVQTIGRLGKPDAFPLLQLAARDRDTAVVATAVWAAGQIREPAAVPWLDSILSTSTTQPTVRTESAIALGKYKTVAAGQALRQFLLAPGTKRLPGMAVGEAILALGRINPRADLGLLKSWMNHPDEELRWRVAWSLMRTKDPAGLPILYALTGDPSALVRSWAVRGFTKVLVDSAADGVGRERMSFANAPELSACCSTEMRLLDSTQIRPWIVERLKRLIADPDRRVQTEAIRSLTTWGEAIALPTLSTAVKSPDLWVAVSAAEGLATFRTATSAAKLTELTAAGHPCALRAVSLQGIQSTLTDSNVKMAIRLASDPDTYCRGIALNIVNRDPSARTPGTDAFKTVEAFATDKDQTIRYTALQGVWTGRDAALETAARRSSRTAALQDSDPVIRAAAIRSMGNWVDSTDREMLLSAYQRGLSDTTTIAAVAAAMVLGNRGAQVRLGDAVQTFLTRFSAPLDVGLRREVDRYLGTPARLAWGPLPTKELAEYRALVERWIVPEYQGKPRPQTEWVTPRGKITIELFAADAPMAMDELLRLTTQGAIVGTQFTRVVADFVNQQATIRGAYTLRDEVNRRGLLRANLAWATSGLDTGAPGFTLGHTPQPHNEGDFTSLGRVIQGLEVMDRIQLGDQILSARMLPPTLQKSGGN